MRYGLFLVLMLTMMILIASPVKASEWSLDAQIGLSDANGFTFNQLSVGVTWEHFSVFAGRELIHFGPGHFGHMVLGPSVGLDSMGFTYNLGPLRFIQFWSDLDGAVDRRLFGHRLEIQIGNLTVGGSETALLTGDIHPSFYLPLPWPYYATQHLLLKNGVMNNVNANILIGFDVHWVPYDQLELYLEIMADDYPLTIPATAPRRTGALLGLAYRDFPHGGQLRMEYARINRYTYCHFTTSSDYVYHGAALGHWIGPDADVLMIEYAWDAADHMRLAGNLILQRRGEGELGDRWVVSLGPGPFFMTGEVENWAGIRFSADWKITDHLSLSGFIESSVVYKSGYNQAEWRFEPSAGLTLKASF